MLTPIPPVETTTSSMEAESTDDDTPATLKSLLSFVERNDTLLIISALVLAALAGAIKPIVAIFLGKIFEDLTSYGAAQLSAPELISKVSTCCIALTALGLASWLINGTFFFAWIFIGERHAVNARKGLFISMLNKEMQWYDLRQDGIGSLLIRIQT
jgi:ATP-binding cassette subfamily B (MDR/TAP) protein 1